jgi:sugar (pentulose or hexulose) kinase
MTGKVYTWLRDSLNKLRTQEKQTQKGQDLDYAEMDKLAEQIHPGSDDMMAFLGSEVMDLKKVEVIRPGMFMFPPPANPMTATPIDARHMIRAVIEMMAYAVNGNKLTIEAVLKRKLGSLKATGGLSRGRVWVKTIADVTGIPIQTYKVKEGSPLGCAICAATGINEYRSLQEAAKNMVEPESVAKPDAEIHESYAGYYDRWRSLYDKITEL